MWNDDENAEILIFAQNDDITRTEFLVGECDVNGVAFDYAVAGGGRLRDDGSG